MWYKSTSYFKTKKYFRKKIPHKTNQQNVKTYLSSIQNKQQQKQQQIALINTVTSSKQKQKKSQLSFFNLKLQYY